MKDSFRRCQAKEIDIGGWRCPCCRPVSKVALRRRARRRLKHSDKIKLRKFE